METDERTIDMAVIVIVITVAIDDLRNIRDASFK